jgi:hypothetical protein
MRVTMANKPAAKRDLPKYRLMYTNRAGKEYDAGIGYLTAKAAREDVKSRNARDVKGKYHYVKIKR